MMKNKELFIKLIESLYSSWGSDCPNEAIWSLNDLVNWIELEYDIKINGRFIEIDVLNEENNIYYDNNQRVIKDIKEKLNSLK